MRILAKSYRTANIRVTGVNETKQDGVVVYNLEDIEEIVCQWSATAGFTYWLIEHSADDEVSRTHFHLVIKFKSPTKFENIKGKFPYGDIESSRNLRASIQYLIHMNDKSKKQYQWEDIHTNCLDMTPYKVQSISQQEITIQGVMESINSGKIREYNQFIEIPIELWAKYKIRIENALIYYRERICMDKNRNVAVIFISGAAGSGKTTFAKDYCCSQNKSFCISSSSNDPLQDYKGEDVLILDDLRDDSFKFHDFIKLLDNHTLSSSKSRYHNKAFIGDTIIITSVKPLQDWYYLETSEDKHQLYRRIQVMYKFTPEKIYAFDYNLSACRYEAVGSATNLNSLKAREKAKMALSILDSMGIQLNPDDREIIERGLANSTDEQLEEMERRLEADDQAKQEIAINDTRSGNKRAKRISSGTRTKRTSKAVPKQ